MSSADKFDTHSQCHSGDDNDIKVLTKTLEEVLQFSGDPNDQKYLEIKNKAEMVLEDFKSRLSHASDSCYYQAKQAACFADDYVHEKPWQAIFISTTIGIFMGLLLSRRI